MHDLVGGAGMLRGWVAVWSMQMLWLLPAMALAVASAALVELLFTTRAARVVARRNAADFVSRKGHPRNREGLTAAAGRPAVTPAAIAAKSVCV